LLKNKVANAVSKTLERVKEQEQIGGVSTSQTSDEDVA
jgi:hypothetical protein